MAKSSTPIILMVLGFCFVGLAVVLGVYFTNIACPFGYDCSTASDQPSSDQPSSGQRSAQLSTGSTFRGAVQTQISGKNFIPLASLYGTFVIVPDSTGSWSNRIYKTPDVTVDKWWTNGGDIQHANSIGNLKFIRIGTNIGKVVNIGGYNVYVYFLDSNGNPIASPYTTSTNLTQFDLGDFSSDQAGAQPDPTLPLAFMPKTYACLLDETPSGENCLIPNTYSDYTDNKPSMFSYTANSADAAKKQRPKGFCQDGYSVRPGDQSNKCSRVGDASAPTAPGVNPGPVPTFSQPPGPVTSCPCDKYVKNGQCVTSSRQMVYPVSGQMYCETGYNLQGSTCVNTDPSLSWTSHPAATAC